MNFYEWYFPSMRHVGDLGNIRQSTNGLVSTQFTDGVISLEGGNDIVGRAIVVSSFIIFARCLGLMFKPSIHQNICTQNSI